MVGRQAGWRCLVYCLSIVLVYSAQSAQAQAPRLYRLSTDLARPVVRILADDFQANSSYRNGTGVLVGRCDVVLTAQHVAVSRNGFVPRALQVYSPQRFGKSVSVSDDPSARALWPDQPLERGNLDGDLAVLKLAACPTSSFVPLSQIRPIIFADLKHLTSVGFACDSGHRRAPEQISLRGRMRPLDRALGLSRAIELTPGARSGQSGSPIYALAPGKAPALTMIMAATVRQVAAPVGCATDPHTGASTAGSVSYGTVLTTSFIAGLNGYIRRLDADEVD